ncbi:unnamed protein product (mitochondrion) [Plasmodiophora brassicae]|uniref:Mitochondrial outer membrane transport complex Sam37/metaxin N-terminal domain-containing protein n=1 Tax=Plasmodiophora brassicae TaxID=37360 RepID=A0A0G4IHB1_PLABS|nr:hypothetical protein PBRA_000358 [Plasmodiophora brassicae]SPQ96918.1 unnamed protein product [Plasmodiophora brassicae]
MRPEDDDQDSGVVIARVGVPAWGLPTWHLQSLELLLLLRIAKRRHAVEYEPYGYTSSTGSLPACEIADGTMLASSEAVERFAEEVDADLGDLARVYRVLCQTQLAPVVDLALFQNEDNFNRVTVGLYRATPFPVSAILPRVSRRESLRRRSCRSGSSDQAILADCKSALRSCEYMLDKTGGPFVLGARPTSCDASLLSFLLLAQRLPVSDPDFTELVTPALARYIDDSMYLVEGMIDALPGTDADPDADATRGINEQYSLYMQQWRRRSKAKVPGDDVRPAPDAPIRTPDDLVRERHNRIAIGIGVGAVVAFLLFGNVIKYSE